MNNNLPKDRQIRNEQIIRAHNAKLKNGILKYFRNSRKIKALPVKFVCECSDLTCNKRVTLSINEYEKIHSRQDRFAIAKNHESPAVEKIVKQMPKFQVVEKHQLSP